MTESLNEESTKKKNPTRDKKISIRVFDTEKKDLLNRCGQYDLATWMRETCLAQNPQILPTRRPPKYPEIDPQLLRQLSGIGNNINQIARHLNSKDFNPVDSVKVISALQSMAENIELIKQQNKGAS